MFFYYKNKLFVTHSLTFLWTKTKGKALREIVLLYWKKKLTKLKWDPKGRRCRVFFRVVCNNFYKSLENVSRGVFIFELNTYDQGFIQAVLTSVRRHKKLNLLIGFSNSIFTNFIENHVGIEPAFKIN